MAISLGILLKSTIWTSGAYVLVQALRLVTNVILARFLAPELFGIMLIAYSLRTGIELISDIGIGQNVVYNRNAEDPDFYNTAWTLQLLRGLILWLVFMAAAVPVAHFYNSPILAYVLPITATTILFGGATSVARPLMQRRMYIARLLVFETTIASISSAVLILLVYLNPTIWSLTFGSLFESATWMIVSFFLLPNVKPKFHLAERFVWQILNFGKWIFVSSIIYFLSMNFDRLYLAKAIPLELLGIYGIARSISVVLGELVLRLGDYVLFPFIAAHSTMPRGDLRKQLISIRAKFLWLAGFSLSIFVSTADLVIKILYDQRYHAAIWMLPVLTIGSWFAILANLNQSTLLGLGKPAYGAMSNSAKLAFLLIGLPLGANIYGLVGAVMVVVFADLCRYIPLLIGQIRERFSFAVQDLIVTLAVFLLIGCWEWLRWTSGYGTSFETLPIGNLSEFWHSQ